MAKRKLAVILLIFTVFSDVMSQEYCESTGREYNYDLTGINILIVLGKDYDYYETVNIKNYWERWGAEVDIAGTERKLTGHLLQKTDKGWDKSETKVLEMDLLLSEIDLSRYEALFFPGGNSPASLLKTDSSTVVNIVNDAYERDKVIAAICHGPIALASSGIVRDKKITGHYDVMRMFKDRVGKYVQEVYVVDGNVITGNWPFFETMAVVVAEKLLYPEGNGMFSKLPFNTNPVFKTIKSSGNVRMFLPNKIEENMVNEIIRAGMLAPIINNEQVWKFVVVKSEETKDKICDSLLDSLKNFYEEMGISIDRVKPYYSNIFLAPVHIFIFCDLREKEGHVLEESRELKGKMETSMACQNIVLAAEASGLGALFVDEILSVKDEVKEILNVPEGVKLITDIAIGYPQMRGIPQVRKHFEKVVFEEIWQEK